MSSFAEGGGPHGEEVSARRRPSPARPLALIITCAAMAKIVNCWALLRQRFKHAAMTDDAVATAPMSLEDYQNARPIIDPLRLFDCSLVGDGAVCAIVSDARAVAVSQAPVFITGAQGVQAGRETFIFAPRGLGVAQQSKQRRTQKAARAQMVYQMAGVSPDEVDVLGLYDSFSPLPVYALEDFGFCAPGEGLDFIQGGRIAHDGALPLNTNGGQLSHAQMNGWGQIRELVTQLRGRAGVRQVANARIGMWGGVGGDALIMTGERP
ncbi:MAG: thiolase family protein [Parvularculaceae bacterium]